MNNLTLLFYEIKEELLNQFSRQVETIKEDLMAKLLDHYESDDLYDNGNCLKMLGEEFAKVNNRDKLHTYTKFISAFCKDSNQRLSSYLNTIKCDNDKFELYNEVENDKLPTTNHSIDKQSTGQSEDQYAKTNSIPVYACCRTMTVAPNNDLPQTTWCLNEQFVNKLSNDDWPSNIYRLGKNTFDSLLKNKHVVEGLYNQLMMDNQLIMDNLTIAQFSMQLKQFSVGSQVVFVLDNERCAHFLERDKKSGFSDENRGFVEENLSTYFDTTRKRSTK